jgi:hypothetical protein
MISAHGPIVNADYRHGIVGCDGSATDDAKQRVVADRKPQTLREGGGWPTAESQAKLVDNMLQP